MCQKSVQTRLKVSSYTETNVKYDRKPQMSQTVNKSSKGHQQEMKDEMILV